MLGRATITLGIGPHSIVKTVPDTDSRSTLRKEKPRFRWPNKACLVGVWYSNVT